MRARTARWLAIAALVLSIAGCGGAPAGDGSAAQGSAVDGPAGTSAPSGGDSSAGADAETEAGAVSVRVVVTGGITGARHVYEVSREDRARGMSAAAAERALALADSPAVRDFAGGHLPSRNVECCDLQVFEVTITYADGSHTRIRTTHTRDLPRELDRMLALLASS